jgi:hypothetical protein
MVRHYAAHAGDAGAEVVPLEHDLIRFYVLTPEEAIGSGARWCGP